MLTLTDALPKAPPGPVAQGAACYLAEIALKMGKLDEAVAVIEELLKSPPPPEIRQRALEILGAARILQKDYRKAAEAYSGMVAVKAQEAKTE
jgi:cytochrome c-type biogenesis protein CcmH/NrfG